MRDYALNHKKFLEEREWRWFEANMIPRLYSPDRAERRHALIFLLGLRTGARCGELRALKPSDFLPKSGSIFITGAKGSKDREIVLPDYLAKAVQKYIEDFPNAKKLYPYGYNWMRMAWVLYRPNPERKLHSLRHTFGLNVYKKTKDIRLVQHALGHKSIANTLIYVDYAYSTQEMRKVIF